MFTNAPACREATFLAVPEMLLFVSFVYRYITIPFLSTAACRVLSSLDHITSEFFKMLDKISSSLHPNVQNDTHLTICLQRLHIFLLCDRKVSQYNWPGD